ncbi:MAG: glutaredoxin family protein [Candidatus Contendobacter sp.]
MKNEKQAPMLILYATSGCHLCEDAENLLRAMSTLPFRTVEITENAALLKRYGRRIPVLHHLDSGAELDWPFAAEAVHRLLSAAAPLY